MELQKDIGEEVIFTLENVLRRIIRLKEELKEKDQKILELENKIKVYQKNGNELSTSHQNKNSRL